MSVEDLPAISEELNAERFVRLCPGGESDGCRARTLWPAVTRLVGNCEQGLPNILLAIGELLGKIWPRHLEAVEVVLSVRAKRLLEVVGLLLDVAAAETLDSLASRLTLQLDADAAALERVAERRRSSSRRGASGSRRRTAAATWSSLRRPCGSPFRRAGSPR